MLIAIDRCRVANCAWASVDYARKYLTPSRSTVRRCDLRATFQFEGATGDHRRHDYRNRDHRRYGHCRRDQRCRCCVGMIIAAMVATVAILAARPSKKSVTERTRFLCTRYSLLNTKAL
jgi:hypothetical protein